MKSNGTYQGKTAEEWRAMARGSYAAKEESFDRCDTDGALSQWCHGLSAQKHELCAEVAENGGRWEFTAIFDLEGNLLDACRVEGRYGQSWMIVRPGEKPIFFNESKARKGATRLKNDMAKGYRLGRVAARAYVDGAGASITSVYYFVRPWLENRHMVDVEIVDNGLRGLMYRDED